MGFRLDIDHVASADFRVVQLTPPGSECSIIIGNAITSAAPGSVQGLQLVVADIEAARAELVDRGVDVGEAFHDVGSSREGVPMQATFDSVRDLAQALRRAAAAYGEHEERTGEPDPDWPDWYAEYIVREQAGEELPS